MFVTNTCKQEKEAFVEQQKGHNASSFIQRPLLCSQTLQHQSF